MSDVVTVRGFVASEVKMTLTESGLPVANFRLGSTERRFDRGRNQWVDAATNWYSVSMFRALAQNASASVGKGERVIVTGKLKLRQWSKTDGRRGIAPEIDADSVGHDLVWGTAKFRRTVQNPSVVAETTESGDPDALATSENQEAEGTQDETSSAAQQVTNQENISDSSGLDATEGATDGTTEEAGSPVGAPF